MLALHCLSELRSRCCDLDGRPCLVLGCCDEAAFCLCLRLLSLLFACLFVPGSASLWASGPASCAAAALIAAAIRDHQA